MDGGKLWSWVARLHRGQTRNRLAPRSPTANPSQTHPPARPAPAPLPQPTAGSQWHAAGRRGRTQPAWQLRQYCPVMRVRLGRCPMPLPDRRQLLPQRRRRGRAAACPRQPLLALNPPSVGSTSPWEAMAGRPRGCGWASGLEGWTEVGPQPVQWQQQGAEKLSRQAETGSGAGLRLHADVRCPPLLAAAHEQTSCQAGCHVA